MYEKLGERDKTELLSHCVYETVVIIFRAPAQYVARTLPNYRQCWKCGLAVELQCPEKDLCLLCYQNTFVAVTHRECGGSFDE